MSALPPRPIFDRPSGRIAVIGSGAAALGAAWLLSRRYDVTVFERNSHVGGHANTVTVPNPHGRTGADEVAVDTGFIVYNDRNYPNLIRMFAALDVPTLASDMSFAVSVDDGGFEYSGGSLAGLLGQPSNLLRPRFYRMVADIQRFYDAAPTVLEHRARTGQEDPRTLGDYLRDGRYSDAFVHDHLLPMAAAIWSAPPETMMAFPITAFVRFCVNHGLLQLHDRPRWRTVQGGSREYVRRITAGLAGRIRTNTPVAHILRSPGAVIVRTEDGTEEHFDEVVIGTHADEALALLADPDPAERALLGAFGYQKNTAVLHGDPAQMPARRRVWSAWNYLGRTGADGARHLCVTYWMNRLQSLPDSLPLFVTLNPVRPPRAETVYRSFDYDHPVFDQAAMAAQRSLDTLQGGNRTWFCGSYFGYGFHEDAFSSGLRVAAGLGCPAPWTTPETAHPAPLRPETV